MTTGMTWGQLALFGALVLLVGLVGGFVNALRTDNGFLMPYRESTEKGAIWRPGGLYNTGVGGIAAFLSWILYGPFPQSITKVVEGATPPQTIDTGAYFLTFDTAASARWRVFCSFRRSKVVIERGRQADPTKGWKHSCW